MINITNNQLLNNALFYLHFLLIAVLMWILIDKVIISISWSHSYFLDFGISDYLINYQGGFVRRGLLGELLYQIYRIHPFNIKIAIIISDILAYILFLCISIRLFIKHKWSILPLIYPSVCVYWGIIDYRRDFLMLLIIYAIYDLFFRYLANKKNFYLAISIILTGFCILIYEPAFFLTVPFLTITMYNRLSSTIFSRLFKSSIIFSLPILTMGFVCLWKGSANQAQEIWASWYPLFEAYPEENMDIEQIGCGVEWLGHSFSETASFHLNLLFGYKSLLTIKTLITNGLLLVSYPMIYFLVTRVPITDFNARRLVPNKNSVILSDVFIFQILVMLPMLTILSCDLGRTIPYCIYTTFFIIHLGEKYQIEINLVNLLRTCSQKIQSYIDASPTLSSAIMYYVIFLFAPLRGCYAPYIRDNIAQKLIILLKRII